MLEATPSPYQHQPATRMPPPWMHLVLQDTDSEKSIPGSGGHPPWFNSLPSSDSQAKSLAACGVPNGICPHGNGSTALLASQGIIPVPGGEAEKPSTTSSSEIASLRAPRCLEGEDGGNILWKLVKNYTPSWYSITMATGMVGLMLHAFPYSNDYIPIIYAVLFIINIITFLAITILTILRYALFPKTWSAMLRHPMQSLFLGCCPMGLTTLINLFIFVCIEDAGWNSSWAPYFAWALWWVDVVMAVACSCGLPFLMMYVHPSTNLSAMTAVWLLPAATPIVTASNGATVASILPNQSHAMITLLTSFVLWGIGFPMALLTLVIYFHRLAMHKLPPREMIITVFMPLGPIGQAAYTIMNLGKESLVLFPKTGTLHELAGDVLYIMGFGVAIILWGFGLVWGFFAVASVTRSRFPFNMGWWGFTFPTGVYVLATLQLGAELPSAFFNILGMIMGIVTILIWFLTVVVTIRKTLLGQVSFAACLQQSETFRRWRKGHNNDSV